MCAARTVLGVAGPAPPTIFHNFLLFLSLSFARPGWSLLGELLKCLRTWSGHTVCGVCGGGGRLLVLWRRPILGRRGIDAWRETGSLLARLLALHQSGIPVGHIHILAARL